MKPLSAFFRKHSLAPPHNSHRFGRIEVLPAQRQVLLDGQPTLLGARAFDLLQVLIAHNDRLLGKDELMALVWPDVVVEENNLTVHISALRKLLGADAIATVPGRGYRFTLQASPDPAAPPTSELILLALPDRPSIAVMPFEARSDDAAIGFLADALVEDVIAQLARVPGFLVISRRSSFEFRQRNEALSSVARQLGVRYIVEGSVRPVLDRLSVSTQLVEAASERVLWSGRFEVVREVAFDLQENIVRGILSELEPELTRAEITLIRRQRPQDVDAWGCYYQAVGALGFQGWNEGAIAEANAALERALVIAPGFALAWAHRAVISALAMTTGLAATLPMSTDAACRAAEHALLLDDGDSQVLGYAGCALADLGQLGRGEEILQHALMLDPSNAQAHVALGATLATKGKFQPGIESMRHGMRISPRDRRLGFWNWALAVFLLRSGQPEEALVAARASAMLDARLHLPRIVEAAALHALGDVNEASVALAAARRLRPILTPAEVELAHGSLVAMQIAPLWPASDLPVA